MNDRNYRGNNTTGSTGGKAGDIDKATQTAAVAVVVLIIALLFLFSAYQTGLLSPLGCSPYGQYTSAADAEAEADPVPPDTVSDTTVSDGDAVSPTDVAVIYYPEVHIDGITLPEEYGAGLFDADAVMWLINEYRSQNGLYLLLPGEFGLQQVTRIRLEEASSLFSHDRPDGTSFSSVYDQTGLFYRFCAENLALGQYTAEEVVRDWIESDTHRYNLLSDAVTHMYVMTGTGNDGSTVWVFEAYAPQ